MSFGSLLFALLGAGVFWLCFAIIDKKYVALAIVVGSMCIAIGLIVSAVAHG